LIFLPQFSGNGAHKTLSALQHGACFAKKSIAFGNQTARQWNRFDWGFPMAPPRQNRGREALRKADPAKNRLPPFTPSVLDNRASVIWLTEFYFIMLSVA
jgi:hypothetical protein